VAEKYQLELDAVDLLQVLDALEIRRAEWQQIAEGSRFEIPDSKADASDQQEAQGIADHYSAIIAKFNRAPENS
jgi:hypothetical protein